ncbi:MAG: potassium-transporting ATPase subunit KdpC [Parachlamydia sp.]|nr:potassium-transporting ATPase subunit KdpC [Parachlamydia sp.]
MKTACRLFLWMVLLTGIAYPLLITGIAYIAFKHQSEGDFINVDGKPVGARLIAQKFESEKYFWPRPSSIDYNPLPSGGSNLGPTSVALKKTVEERKSALTKAHPGNEIPSELLFASGSGLDPHISPQTAYYQVDRIVKARGLDPQKGKEALEKLILSHTEGRHLAFLGNPCVNVLMLNLALDTLNKDTLKKT